MNTLIIIVLILIYIISVIFLHLYYRTKFIEYYKNRIENRPYGATYYEPTLNGFYNWLCDSDISYPIVFLWIPFVNTICVICIIIYVVFRKIGSSIKFI